MGWYDMRFIERDGAVRVVCEVCSRDMWLPRSRSSDYKRCSSECTRLARQKAYAALERACETCKSTFRPRPNQVRNGGGRFCSQKCNTASHVAITAPEVLARGKETMAKMRAAGKINYRSGPDNPCWKGGKSAMIRRLLDSGKLTERVREYRRRNPDKVREFTQRRADRKLGKLPYGTIPAIRIMQRNRCAICKTSIAKAYHVDHVMPLARGGRHERANIQLLCPPCNLAKSSRDPIDHMRSLGRLL